MEIKNGEPTDTPGVVTTVVRWDHSDAGRTFLVAGSDRTWAVRLDEVDDQRGVRYTTLAGTGFPERAADGWVPGMPLEGDIGVDSWEPRTYRLPHYTWQTPVADVTATDVDQVVAGVRHAGEQAARREQVRRDLGAFSLLVARTIPNLLDRRGIEDPEWRERIKDVLQEIGDRKTDILNAASYLEMVAHR